MVRSIREASPGDLARERDLLKLLLAPRHLAVGDAIKVSPTDTELAGRLLLAARSEVRSQVMGTRAVRRAPRLAWGLLEELLEGEDHIRRVVLDLKTAPSTFPQVEDVLELVNKYLAGWCPTISTA